MKNILSYAATKCENFSVSPFNCSDALILCWIAYFTYPDYLKGGKQIALNDLNACNLLPDKQMYASAFLPKKSKKLFTLMQKSKRFSQIEISDFMEEKDKTEEKQFGAITIKFGGNKFFLAFRGTDPSFIGWKENLNLLYNKPIPSQVLAAEYLKLLMRKYPDGEFYLGGHSKGGNLAIYAAACADESMQSAIKAIYNFDGPALLNGIYPQAGFNNIEHKIYKIIPKASFVGMLFETRNSFEIIKSSSFSFLQHDPFNWRIKNDDFLYLKKRTHGSVRLERALNKWIAELTFDERKRLIGLVSSAFKTLDTDDFNVFFKTFYRQIPALYRQYRVLEPDDKLFFNTKLKRLNKLLKSARQ